MRVQGLRMLSSADSLLRCTARIEPQLAWNRKQLEFFRFDSAVKVSREWDSRKGCVSGGERGAIIRAMATNVDASAGKKSLQSWEALAGMLAKDDALESRLPNVKTRVFEEGQEPALVFYRQGVFSHFFEFLL